ncbi:MAG: hypothetical protein ACD_39C01910G0002 [uncultured bacterium]|nr:MAG: hypothetical protein ACD_39C01910G0002 [uncultured bacterium]
MVSRAVQFYRTIPAFLLELDRVKRKFTKIISISMGLILMGFVAAENRIHSSKLFFCCSESGEPMHLLWLSNDEIMSIQMQTRYYIHV